MADHPYGTELDALALMFETEDQSFASEEECEEETDPAVDEPHGSARLAGHRRRGRVRDVTGSR